MVSRLTFIRHAHTVWNGPPKRFQGRADVSLSEKGLLQCRSRRGDFDWVKRVVSSPAIRVRQTIETIFEHTEQVPIISYDDNLWEIDNGFYQGNLLEEVKKKWPNNFQDWMTTPGETRPGNGESLLELLSRAVISIRKIKKTPLEGTLVATHGGIIRVLMLASENRSLNEFHELSIDNLQEFTLTDSQVEELDYCSIL